MKYDKCLNINVHGFSEQKKKLVQDAFHKLGYKWNDGITYNYLNANQYSNHYDNSNQTEKYMKFSQSKVAYKDEFTVIFNELMEIAGMTEHLEPTFTKSDLKTGMILELNSGDIVMVLLNTNNGDIVSGDNWFPLKDYTDDTLFNPNNTNSYSVKSVYQPRSNKYHSLKLFNPEHKHDYEVVWERKTETPQQKELRLLEDKQRELAKQQSDLAEQMKTLRDTLKG
jgi:hypothetical protein